jgi:TetR/AcrR family transcriptional regulator, regulator of cefoperazone and chloramphenicol sensitivity
MAKEAEIVDLAKGRDRLIKVTMGLFADRGFDGVTVRDIASAAGVSVGLINHHFGSKEGLREAVDRYFLAQFEEVLTSEDLRERPGSTVGDASVDEGLEQYAEWVDGWIGRHIDDWDASKAYMRRALLEGSDWGASLFERFYQVARTTVDRADVRGNIRPDVDRLWLPFLMIYLEVGTLLLEPFVERILGKSPFDRTLWQRRHRAYVDLMYNGVLPTQKN